MPRLLFALAGLLSLTAAAGERPTRAALRKAAERATPALVEVLAAKRKAPGLIVGAGGHVVTLASLLPKGAGPADAGVKVKWAGERRPAKLLAVSTKLKLVMIQLEGPGEFRAVPVDVGHTFAPGEWLLALSRRRDGKWVPVAGKCVRPPSEDQPLVEVDLPLAPGAPVLDGRGRLVAVAVERRGRVARAAPIAALKRELDTVAPPPEDQAR